MTELIALAAVPPASYSLVVNVNVKSLNLG